MGQKTLVAMATEGRFSGEGLQSMGDEDLMTALARELVNDNRVGESADAIWASIAAQRATILSLEDMSATRVEASGTGLRNEHSIDMLHSSVSPESAREVAEAETAPWSIDSAGPEPVFTWSTVPGSRRKMSPRRIRSRRLPPKPTGQLSFFEMRAEL